MGASIPRLVTRGTVCPLDVIVYPLGWDRTTRRKCDRRPTKTDVDLPEGRHVVMVVGLAARKRETRLAARLGRLGASTAGQVPTVGACLRIEANAARLELEERPVKRRDALGICTHLRDVGLVI